MDKQHGGLGHKPAGDRTQTETNLLGTTSYTLVLFQQIFSVYHGTVCASTLLRQPGVRTRVQPVHSGIPASDAGKQLLRQYQIKMQSLTLTLNGKSPKPKQ